MSIVNINLGTTAGDKTGTKARAAGQIINDNFAYLESKIDNINYLSNDAGYDLTGTDLTMNAGWVWTIEGAVYTNPVDVVISVPLAASGYSRIDLIVCNTSNTFTRVAGTPSLSTPVSPVVPDNTILAVFYVSDSSAVSAPVIVRPRFSVSQLIREGVENTAPSEAAVFDGLAAVAAGITFSGTQDDVPDGTTYKQYSANEKAKLADTYIKSEVDAKVSSLYKLKGSVANYAALPGSGQVVGDVWNLTDTGANYVWTGTVWDELGTTVDISGKENTSNKTNTITGNETSTSLYASVKCIVDWLTSTKIKSLLGITTLSGSNTGDQDLTPYALAAISVVKISTNTTLDNTYNGKIILLTASCTLTLPNGLMTGFNYSVKTRAGVTLTYSLGGSVAILDNLGTTMAEKLSHTMANTTTANEYLSVGSL